MTDNRGLRLTPDEWEALALKWHRMPETEQAEFRETMTRPQSRRFDRMLETMHEGKRNYANKMTTRAEVIQILAMYIDRNLIPLAARMDAMEARLAYFELPWHRKLRTNVLVWAARAWDTFERFLGKLGITLVKMENEDEGIDRADTGSLGSEAGHTAEGAGEVRSGPAIDGLSGGHTGPRLEPGHGAGHDAGGARPDIRVVSR